MDLEAKKEIEKLTNQVDRLNAAIRQLIQDKNKKTWVNVEWIIRLTGWTAEELRQAREGKLIEFKTIASRRHKYVLESVPPQFIRKTA